MNKNLFNLIGIILLSMVAFTFNSCDDDPIEKEDIKTSKLVGVWKYGDPDDYTKWQFNSDGTGVLTEYDGYYDELEVEEFAYEFFEETGVLKGYFGDEVEYCYIRFINNNSFRMYDMDSETHEIDYEDWETYIRQ